MKCFFYLGLFIFSNNLHSQILSADLTTIATGFDRPVDIKFTDDNKIFIVEQDGKIKIISNGTVLATPFLDIDSKVGSVDNEQGLLGLAFSPDYVSSGKFYVNYTNNSGDTVISRFTVSSNINIADSDSEVVLLTIPQPYSNHNGGHLAFGQDNYLYIGTGDGGSGGDPDNYAQNGNSLLGKILRIDVNGNYGYNIPVDNPFVNDSSVLDEIWALGLRNPWRFSFDKQNGDLWIGDVGQNAIEEIDRLTISDSGVNLGWRCYEGNSPYNTSGCSSASNYFSPIAQYNQGGSPYKVLNFRWLYL
jgi:glucose/arabinose dehydrogenase